MGTKFLRDGAETDRTSSLTFFLFPVSIHPHSSPFLPLQDETHRDQYKEMADRILSALDFMRVCGVESEAALKTVSEEGARKTICCAFQSHDPYLHMFPPLLLFLFSFCV